MPTLRSPWQEPPRVSNFDTIPPASSDVCILGAGIAGLSVAYELARRGRNVTVLDAQSLGQGMTGHTSAHLSSIIDDRFENVLRIRGRDLAQMGYQAHTAAIDRIEDTIGREGIDCGFQRVDGYLVLAEGEESDILERELDAARTLGVDVADDTIIPGDCCGGRRALRFPNQARFEPLAYLAGLAAAVRKYGGVICPNTRVHTIEDGEPSRIRIKDRTLSANTVVVATNSPVTNRVTTHTKQFPYTTYCVGLQVAKESVPDALIWDTADPYHYVRRSGDTLIVGGGDHKAGHRREHADVYAHLADWARRQFPGLGPMTHRWCGQVYETLDGFAYIGLNPGDEHVFIVTGDSGMGLTHGTIAGELLPALITEGSHPWAKVFAPSRMPLAGTSDFISENVDVAVQYADWLSGSEVDSIKDIPPGQGAVMRSGISKLAVYKDEKHHISTCSAKCPHLGAVVGWNDAAQEWECPAHGSRFAPNGQVVQGPANCDLKPLETP